jgi:hypothetical protein
LAFAAFIGFHGNVGLSLLYGHLGDTFIAATDIVFEFTGVLDSAADVGDDVMLTVHGINSTIMEAIPSVTEINTHQVGQQISALKIPNPLLL